MSRRKQSHPRAWKETVDSKQNDKRDAYNRPESPSDRQHSSSDPEDRGSLDPLSFGFLHSLQEASIGETFGPVAATIWEDSRVPVSAGKLLSDSEVTRSLRMVLTTSDGSEESFTFFPVHRREDAHLVVQRNSDGMYVKVAKKFDSATELRGFCVSMERQNTEFENVQVKQEPSDEPSECHPHSRTSQQGEEESPFISKKCPNCSVCFRNAKNLEAHQRYYCTGLARSNHATTQHDHETCKRLDVSQSSSPSLPSRSSSRTSTDALDAPIVHVCQLCQSSFTSRQNCESHMLILHCSEHVAMCKFCNFVAQSWDILREHVFSHVKMERRSEEDLADNDQQISCHDCEGHAGHREDPSPEKELTSHSSQHRVPLNGVQRELIHSPSGHKVPTDTSSRLHHDTPQMLQDDRPLKRLSDSGQSEAKRTRKECFSPSTHQKVKESNFQHRSFVGIHPGELAHPTRGRTLYPEELASLPTPTSTVCTACNICFRSKANYVAHKKYYCKERHSENKDLTPVGNDSRDLPTYISPRTEPTEFQHHDETDHDVKESTKSRESPPGTAEPRVMKPPPVMYMSPVVPSAMLVGGTQLISPTGAHVISPIFLLAPPVAIPVTSMAGSLSSPSSESRSKRIGKDDSPLDLSVRPSTASPEDTRRSSPIVSNDTARREVLLDQDNVEPEDPSTSKKSFSCIYCGVTFWKAKTLIAHKQFYCSKINKSASESPARSSHHMESIPVTHASTSPRDGEFGKLETQLRETSAMNSPPSYSKRPDFRKHSHSPDSNKTEGTILIDTYKQEYQLQERQRKPIYVRDTLIHHLHGLHHCSGCGVAFRKTESLEIHKKFYCQKSKPAPSPTASGHSAMTPQKLNGHWQDRLQRSNVVGPDRSQGDNLELHQLRDSVPITSSHSLKKIQKDLRCADSSTSSEAAEMSKKHGIGWYKDKERRGSSSPVLGGREGYSSHSSSSPRDHGRLRARSWPSSVGKSPFTRCFKKLNPERPLSFSLGHIPKMLTVKSESPSLPHCQNNSQLDNCDQKQEFDSSHQKVSIKVEQEDSQPGCEAANSPFKSKPETAQIAMDGKSQGSVAHFSQSIRQTESSFPPGSKACRSCNISFRSLSTFIAHKKYYCSSATNQRSKVTT